MTKLKIIQPKTNQLKIRTISMAEHVRAIAHRSTIIRREIAILKQNWPGFDLDAKCSIQNMKLHERETKIKKLEHNIALSFDDGGWSIEWEGNTNMDGDVIVFAHILQRLAPGKLGQPFLFEIIDGRAIDGNGFTRSVDTKDMIERLDKWLITKVNILP